MCSRLARMLHRCLPESFGAAGRIHGHGRHRAASSVAPSPLPPTKEDAARGAGGDDRPTGGGAWFDGEDDDGAGSEVDALGESGGVGLGGGAENGERPVIAADKSGRRQGDDGGDGEPSADSRGKEPAEWADDNDDEGGGGAGAGGDSGNLNLGVAVERAVVGDNNAALLRAIPSGRDSLTLSADGEESPSRRRRPLLAARDDALLSPGFQAQEKSPAAKRRLSLSRLEDGDAPEEFDGARAAGLLAAALRVQRLLYGMARLHLRGLGQEQARVLMDGLSAGLRYAREFQAHHGLRAALYSAG